MGNIENAIIYMRLLLGFYYLWFKGKVLGNGKSKGRDLKSKLNKRILK